MPQPMVARDLWEMAQAVRQEKARQIPNNPGSLRSQVRSYTWAKDQRVYPLQGLLTCAFCGSLMTPHYVFHRARNGRRKDSFSNHYVCTEARKYGTGCDHCNRVLARVAEQWVLQRVEDLVQSQRFWSARFDMLCERVRAICSLCRRKQQDIVSCG
jgi:hypothetical protein